METVGHLVKISPKISPREAFKLLKLIFIEGVDLKVVLITAVLICGDLFVHVGLLETTKELLGLEISDHEIEQTKTKICHSTSEQFTVHEIMKEFKATLKILEECQANPFLAKAAETDLEIYETATATILVKSRIHAFPITGAKQTQ